MTSMGAIFRDGFFTGRHCAACGPIALPGRTLLSEVVDRSC